MRHGCHLSYHARISHVFLLLSHNLAEVFGISTQALTVPDIDSYDGLMHTLFKLGDLYGLRIDKLSDEVCIRLDKGMGTNYITMFEMFSAW